jgi:hypothetical protein
MVLVNLIESFERYLKEVAAVCIDLVGAYVLDDRFDTFRLQGSALAVHFGTDTLGRALCESSTWLDTASINNRFKSLLADPFEEGQKQLTIWRRADSMHLFCSRTIINRLCTLGRWSGQLTPAVAQPREQLS